MHGVLAGAIITQEAQSNTVPKAGFWPAGTLRKVWRNKQTILCRTHTGAQGRHCVPMYAAVPLQSQPDFKHPVPCVSADLFKVRAAHVATSCSRWQVRDTGLPHHLQARADRDQPGRSSAQRLRCDAGEGSLRHRLIDEVVGAVALVMLTWQSQRRRSDTGRQRPAGSCGYPAAAMILRVHTGNPRWQLIV